MTRDLSKLFRSLDEQYPYAHVESDTQAESSQREMTASLALLKLQIVIAPGKTAASGRLMSMFEALREKLAPELLRYEEMAKEATRTISPTTYLLSAMALP